MSFWKKSKHPYKSERLVTEVSLPTLARWYAYDAGLDHPDEVADALGMLPTSEDGVRMEEQDSDRRTERVMPLIPLIETIADINAQAIATLQMDNYTNDQGMDPDDLAHERIHIEDMYRQIGFSALLAGISAGIELGILETNAIGGGIINGK
jgi:hypothetical protein